MISNPLAITVDIEDWYHIPSVTGSPFSVYPDVNTFFSKWRGRYDFLSNPTKQVLTLLDEFHIKATFFIVADVIEHYPGLVESIAERGHEIACHGLHHACVIDPDTKVPLYSRGQFREETNTARKMLEIISDTPVQGYRAPNAVIAGWMLDILEDLGFDYDSSVCANSFYNKSDSNLQNVTSVPYYPMQGQLVPGPSRHLMEFPWSYLDIGKVRIPTAGGPMLRFLPVSLIRKGVQQSLKRGPTAIYIHPIDIAQEPFPRVGKGRPFYWLMKGKIVEKKLRTLLYSFQNIHKLCMNDLYKEIK